MLKKYRTVVGPLRCNCTILVCEKTNEGIVIDPGAEFAKIKQVCEKSGVKLKYAFHTHAHFDHIGATEELKNLSPATQLLLHKDDQVLYENLPMQGTFMGVKYDVPPKIDQFVIDDET